MSSYKFSISSGETVQYRSYKAIIYMGIALAILLAALKDFIPAVVVVSMVVLVMVLRKKLLIDYDYTLEDKMLYIRKIVGKKNSRAEFSFNLKDVILMAPEASDEIKKIQEVSRKAEDYFPKNLRRGIYTVILTENNEKLKIKFIPDENMINLIGEQISDKLKRP